MDFHIILYNLFRIVVKNEYNFNNEILKYIYRNNKKDFVLYKEEGDIDKGVYKLHFNLMILDNVYLSFSTIYYNGEPQYMTRFDFHSKKYYTYILYENARLKPFDSTLIDSSLKNPLVIPTKKVSVETQTETPDEPKIETPSIEIKPKPKTLADIVKSKPKTTKDVSTDTEYITLEGTSCSNHGNIMKYRKKNKIVNKIVHTNINKNQITFNIDIDCNWKCECGASGGNVNSTYGHMESAKHRAWEKAYGK